MPRILFLEKVAWVRVKPLELLAAFVLFLFATAKFRLFSHLAYTSDLFTALQMSYSWMLGKPLLFDGRWGSHLGIHNYLTIPLLGPVTLAWGARGLFVAYLLSLFGALCLAMSELRRRSCDPTGQSLIILTLFAGPVSFWIFDNPTYGFHPEFFFLPLALVYAIGILRGRNWRWIALALLCLTREEGPLVALSVNVLAVWLLDSHSPVRIRLKRTAWLCAGFAALMMIGMLPLVLHPAPASRLNLLNGSLLTSGLPKRALVSFLKWVVLIFPLLAALMYIARSLRAAGLLLLAVSPVLACIMVASAVYGFYYLDATWPPRFVMTWAAGAGSMFLAAESPVRRPHRAWSTLFSIALVFVQSLSLFIARNYSLTDRLFHETFLGDRLTTSESQFINCLGSTLPRAMYVASSGDLFAAFERQWVFGANAPGRIAKSPDLVVCYIEGRSSFPYGCDGVLERKQAANYGIDRIDGVAIVYRTALARYVTACHAQAGPAGNSIAPVPNNELISLPVSKVPTANFLATINGISDFSHPPTPIPRGAFLIVSGWAVDLAARQAASRVYIDSDGDVHAARYGSDRPDVAMAFKEPAFIHSGYVAILPGDLGRGEHRISVKIVNRAASAYYVGQSVTIVLP